MIKQKSIDSVMAAVRIEDVVGDFVSLRKQGQDFVGICPFHDDKNPSLHVSPRLGIYKCFVCDAAGNPVKFLMEHEKMSYPEAIEYLAKKYGIPLEYERNESEEERQQRSLRESLLIVNEFALKFFMDQLRNTEEGKLMGMTYLKERGFQDATIDKFQLGYSPDAWDSFTKAALEKGYKEEYLIELGLTGKAQSGKLYDIYRGRVIFPIHNDAGKVIGFGGRILKKDGKDPRKYVNSRENTIYHKSDTLYGIYFAKNAIHKQQNVYLVEGYTDVISMHESGVENVVASSGTSLTQGQIRMITKRTQNITVLYDGDMAGIKASMRGIDMLLEQGLKIRVCLLPDGEDPDSFAKKHRDSELQEYLSKESKDFLLFKADILSKDAGNDPIKRASMVNEILKSISCVKDNIERAFYIKECAKLFDLSENDLNLNLRRFVWEKTKEQSRTAQQQAQQQQMEQITDSIAKLTIYNRQKTDSVASPTSYNRQMKEHEETMETKQIHVKNAIEKGIVIIDKAMSQTNIDQHLDTLSSLLYIWPDFTMRSKAGYQATETYLQQLESSFDENERAQIAEVMNQHCATIIGKWQNKITVIAR